LCRTSRIFRIGSGRVANTRPSHALADYTGDYEHPAYGVLKIGLTDQHLQFDFHKIVLPLTHFHYDLKIDVVFSQGEGALGASTRGLSIVLPGAPPLPLKVTSLKQRDPGGEFTYPKKQ
jgi:hypothetical protein